jgi:antitoxin YefM
MTSATSYTRAREHLAELLDRAEQDREIIVIQRRGHEDVSLISSAELASLLETAHLLRSPRNARRLFSAIARALDDVGRPETANDLRHDLGLASSLSATH